jgi:hypothetical protein
MYHKENGITTMEKHAKVEHQTLFAKYVEHVTNCLKFPLDQKLLNERFHMKIDHHHWIFLLLLPICKRLWHTKMFHGGCYVACHPCFLPFKIMKSNWFQSFMYMLCPMVVFPSKNTLCVWCG